MKKVSNNQLANNWGGQSTDMTAVYICVAEMMYYTDTDFNTSVFLCALAVDNSIE